MSNVKCRLGIRPSPSKRATSLEHQLDIHWELFIVCNTMYGESEDQKARIRGHPVGALLTRRQAYMVKIIEKFQLNHAKYLIANDLIGTF